MLTALITLACAQVFLMLAGIYLYISRRNLSEYVNEKVYETDRANKKARLSEDKLHRVLNRIKNSIEE